MLCACWLRRPGPEQEEPQQNTMAPPIAPPIAPAAMLPRRSGFALGMTASVSIMPTTAQASRLQTAMLATRNPTACFIGALYGSHAPNQNIAAVDSLDNLFGLMGSLSETPS